MTFETIIGTIAATLTTLSSVPQAIKIIKTGRTEDISLLMYIAATIGVSFWIIYGLLLQQWPIIIANIFTVMPTAFILFMKIKK